MAEYWNLVVISNSWQGRVSIMNYSQVPIIRRLGRAQFFSEYGDWGGMSRVLSFLGNLTARSYEN